MAKKNHAKRYICTEPSAILNDLMILERERERERTVWGAGGKMEGEKGGQV